MKKTLLLFVFSLFLFSCGNDDEVVNPLVGKWQIVKTVQMNDCDAQSWIEFTQTTFKEKKVYQSLGVTKQPSSLKVDCLSLETNYDYTISGDIIKAKVIAKSLLKDDLIEKDIKFSISGNKLTLTTNGTTIVYEK